MKKHIKKHSKNILLFLSFFYFQTGVSQPSSKTIVEWYVGKPPYYKNSSLKDPKSFEFVECPCEEISSELFSTYNSRKNSLKKELLAKLNRPISFYDIGSYGSRIEYSIGDLIKIKHNLEKNIISSTQNKEIVLKDLDSLIERDYKKDSIFVFYYLEGTNFVRDSSYKKNIKKSFLKDYDYYLKKLEEKRSYLDSIIQSYDYTNKNVITPESTLNYFIYSDEFRVKRRGYYKCNLDYRAKNSYGGVEPGLETIYVTRDNLITTNYTFIEEDFVRSEGLPDLDSLYNSLQFNFKSFKIDHGKIFYYDDVSRLSPSTSYVSHGKIFYYDDVSRLSPSTSYVSHYKTPIFIPTGEVIKKNHKEEEERVAVWVNLSTGINNHLGVLGFGFTISDSKFGLNFGVGAGSFYSGKISTGIRVYLSKKEKSKNYIKMDYSLSIGGDPKTYKEVSIRMKDVSNLGLVYGWSFYSNEKHPFCEVELGYSLLLTKDPYVMVKKNGEVELKRDPRFDDLYLPGGLVVSLTLPF